MNSHYLAQYLVNEGKIATSDAAKLLEDIKDKDPQLPVMSLKMKMLDGKTLMSLDTSSSGNFGKDALQKNLLSEDQLQKLHRQIPGETMRFAQALLDYGLMNFDDVEKAFAAYDEATDPVKVAVSLAGGDELAYENDLYGSYMKLFMDSLVDFMHTPVIIEPSRFSLSENYFSGTVYEVSQRIMGDITMVGGLVAKEPTFIRLAARYSQEDLTEADDLAIDSMEEFFNVINGLFCIQLAERNRETELGLPRWNKNIMPHGSQQLILNIHVDFGSFVVVLASDEFM